MRLLERRKVHKLWSKSQQFASEMRDHGIDKIVIERIPASNWAEMTLYVDGSDEPWTTIEFVHNSPIKKWLRKHFYML